METRIGHTFQGHRIAAWLAVVVAVVAVATDMWLAASRVCQETPRLVVAVIAISMMAALCRGNRDSLGVTPRMLPSYWYWTKVTLFIGVAVGLFCVVSGVVLHFVGIHIPMPATPPDQILSSLIYMCVKAPLLEESTYRLVLCVPLVAVAGSRATIFLAGAVFAALHFVYGNPTPDNFIAGYFLVWAFLKSGSIATPILLHSLGNACALAAHVIHWQMMK
jgi:membrane protease YdiL (CAAX protease family)